MELKYAGAMPRVSSRGVGFDQSKPDKYTFLNAAVELLEALSFGETETTKHLHHISQHDYKPAELTEHLKKFCPDLDALWKESNTKAQELVDGRVKAVNENKTINEDERDIWLKNISLMRNYYLQYVINESTYKCALQVLAEEIHNAHIEEVTFPAYRHYGEVLHDLIYVLEHRKPPIDANLIFETTEGVLVGKLSIKHQQ